MMKHNPLRPTENKESLLGVSARNPLRHRILILFATLLFTSFIQGQSTEFVPREFYHAKLEPESTILHGAGQCDAKSFLDYSEVVGPTLAPVFFMDYAGLVKFATPESSALTLKGTRKLLKLHPNLMLQLGLAMTYDGKPNEVYDHEVADGKHDEAIKNLCQELKTLGCPILVRIGYECNGHWNGYQAEPYKKAFQRVTKALRENEVNAATVWCAYPVDLKTAMPYYPGDAFVDWWSLDLFFPGDLTDSKTTEFLKEAHRRKRPVLIGESTPRGVGVTQGEASWEKWYAPYFDLIRRSPGIKAFSYINWNWANFKQWHDWGDARLQENPIVAERYRAALTGLPFKSSATP